MWYPIESARKDGRPVWARKHSIAYECYWVYWHRDGWKEAGEQGRVIPYLTDYWED